MNSRMGFVASLFGVYVGDEFNIINGAGVDMGTYRFVEHGVAPVNSRNTDAYVLQELLNGSYQIKSFAAQNRKLCEFSPLGGFSSKTLISRGRRTNI